MTGYDDYVRRERARRTELVDATYAREWLREYTRPKVPIEVVAADIGVSVEALKKIRDGDRGLTFRGTVEALRPWMNGNGREA